jgi:formate transporter
MAKGGVLSTRLDALLPAEMADRCERIGARKASLDTVTTLGQAFQAGAFVALGACLMTVVLAASRALPYGVGRLAGGLALCAGLIPIVMLGAELFVGDNLVVMAFASRKIRPARLLRHWGLVYAGNLLGAASVALLALGGLHLKEVDGSLIATALTIAADKCALQPLQAVALGLMGSVLVCLATWLCFSAHSPAEKVLLTLFPISALAASGFEHVIANMYFVPLGLLIRATDPATVAALARAGLQADVAGLTLANWVLHSLLPVTLGNLLGGGGLVGLTYWLLYLRRR